MGEEDKMASTSESDEVKQPPNSRKSNDLLGLHEMFKIVGDQMTTKDVRSLKFLYKRFMPVPVYAKVNDGFSFLLALERLGRLDETNFKYLLQVLRIITRHDLSQYVSLRRRKPVVPDPVDEYLQRSADLAHEAMDSRNLQSSRPKKKSNKPHEHSILSEERPAKRPRFGHIHSIRMTRSRVQGDNEASDNQQEASSIMCSESSAESEEIKKKVTCDIRLRVRAEYCDHDSALEGNIFSNKADLFERRIEKFMQANTILKSRDLGSIICDIKFSELTYLDAFWRDYINGSLLEALKGVFITESLKQAVGHEAIKLLVNVDEDDYEAGRVKLLQNLID